MVIALLLAMDVSGSHAMNAAASSIEQAVDYIERRTSMRFSVSVEVDLHDERFGQLRYEAIDISRGGAFLRRIDSQTPLPEHGSTVNLLLRWPVDTPTPPVAVKAIVVRCTTDGVGVSFQY